MTLNKIIDKICKCLRLAESANPNEAASALRQAVSLMQKYDINDEQVNAYEISLNRMNEASVVSSGCSKPSFWVLALSNLVADVFECRVYLSRKLQTKPEFIFIGVDNRPEVASYIYTILYRSLGRARVSFMKGLEQDSCVDAKTNSVKERRRRANIFAQAWLFRVSKKVKSFKDNKATKVHINKPVDAYVDKKYGATLDYIQEPVETKAPDYDDIMLGMHAAADVSLFRPLKKMNNHFLLAAVS